MSKEFSIFNFTGSKLSFHNKKLFAENTDEIMVNSLENRNGEQSSNSS